MTFKESLDEFTKKIKIQVNQIIVKIRAMPENKLIAYGSIILGLFFILLAIILW